MRFSSRRDFSTLSEKEILALAIQNEEEDGRIYLDLADGVRETFPATAKALERMSEEENGHRRRLLDLFQKRFGNHIPLVRREDIKGFLTRKPVWLMRPLRLKVIHDLSSTMEAETCMFYRKSASKSTDPDVRKLLEDLALEEQKHNNLAQEVEQHLKEPATAEIEAEAEKKLFVLQVIQPALAGLMDGSVSTLAPLFAAAFATGQSKDAFAVGLAASFGAGISMGFAEALSDDGSLTGRGHPWIRGLVCGLMTTVGGLGHTLPYLIPDFATATVLAVCIVVMELLLISYIRYKYMDTPVVSATFQVVVGGLLVFLTGYFIGILVPGAGG